MDGFVRSFYLFVCLWFALCPLPVSLPSSAGRRTAGFKIVMLFGCYLTVLVLGKCAMSTVTGVVAYVIKNVFSRVRNTDRDMFSRSAAGKLFHTVGPLTMK